MRVNPGNVTKFEEQKSLVCGIAAIGDYVVAEYLSSSRSGTRHVLVARRDGVIWHSCKAAGNLRPCWHLAIPAKAFGWTVPWEVMSNITISPPIPNLPWKDVSPSLLGRPGDFTVIKIDDREETPETSPAEETPPESGPALPEEDAWLNDYNLPARLLEKVLAFRAAQKSRLTPEQAARVPQARYIPGDGELVRAVAALLYGQSGDAWEAPLLIGPKGSGKSTLAETLAAILHLPVQKVFGGIDVNAEWLLGGKTLEPVEGLDPLAAGKLRAAAKAAGLDVGDVLSKATGTQLRVAFEPGVLLQAVQAGEMVVVDEVNMLVPEVTSLLHGLLDWQKSLAVPGVGAVKAHPSFRLVGCMNYGYAGTKDLNEAFQDRFRSVQVPHLPEGRLAELLVRETSCPEEDAGKLASLFAKLANRVENGDLFEKVLSVRALIRAIREVQDGCGTLKQVTMSALTEGLGDKYARDQVSDIVEACL